MLGACYSQSLAKRPSLPSLSPVRVRVPNWQLPLSLALPTRAARLVHLRCNSARSVSRFGSMSWSSILDSFGIAVNEDLVEGSFLYLLVYALMWQNWRISCFKDQDLDRDLGPEWQDCSVLGSGNGISEECAKRGLNPEVAVKDWKARFREASYVLFKAIGKQWSVPWTIETVLQVMVLWVTSFWFIGTWVLPFLVHMAGFNKEALTFRGQALYSLLTDVAEGIAGVAILHRCLSRFYPLSRDWFRFSLKGKWHFDVALGCLMFPVVNRLSQINLDLLPILPSTPVTLSSVEQSILARDPVAMSLYAIVVTICAPVWEEIVFRGFLLPSLTRYMPVWCAIIVSSVAFALAHFNVQRMLPLVFLGLVMGVLFTRSRNLVPSMLLHSLWNAFVFASLIR